jgi:agmatinase
MTHQTPTLIGLPYDSASSYRRGPAAAPPLIREALHSPASNSWSESGIDVGRPRSLADAGDVDLANTADVRGAIEAGLRRIVQDGGRPIVLGGDHSVTYPVLRVLRPLHRSLTVLHFDAHPDLYEEFEGNRFSHACPFARVMDERLADRLVQVGIRTMNAHQRAQADRHGVEVIDMLAWTAGMRPTVGGAVYISLDVDVLDPAFAPGVSHREPGGLSVRDVITVLQAVPGPIVGADVVEFNPTQDPVGLTAPVCAKLVKELAARMVEVSGE